ncbi:nitrogen fixation protein NifR [Staphylococcus aureus]|nr:nitrogen fixation protein NifR [Staphylococcus aureus]
MCKLGCGPQQREFETPISTDNASWRCPNIEAGGKSAYNNVQVGVGRRNKFCENIISVSVPFNA